MSSTPPEVPEDATEVTVTEARGGVSTGVIWVLIISLILAVILVLGVWVLYSHSLSTLTHPHAQDRNRGDISTYQQPSPGARPSAGDQPAANAQ